jgi:hypothetical protein
LTFPRRPTTSAAAGVGIPFVSIANAKANWQAENGSGSLRHRAD